MRLPIAASALLLAALPATAQDIDTMTKAMSLGTLIGSEEYCGLTFDQAAIEAWVEKNIPPEAMDFPQHMGMGRDAETYEQASRSPSAKTAHCAGVTRTAKHYGFTS